MHLNMESHYRLAWKKAPRTMSTAIAAIRTIPVTATITDPKISAAIRTAVIVTASRTPASKSFARPSRVGEWPLAGPGSNLIWIL